jgi:hypothetical protein
MSVELRGNRKEVQFVTTPSTNTQKDTIPFGVSVIAQISIIIGFFSIWIGVNADAILLGQVPTLVDGLKIGDMIIGVLLIIAGFGFWKMKYWAWLFVTILVIVGLILNIGVVVIDYAYIHRYFLAILIRILLIAYLLQPQIKGRFK